MRILKYIFLLLLLAFIALAVFVATQKGDYEIVRSKIIKSPKSTVYNYVNDFHNWENWIASKDNDPEISFTYPEKTIGIGGSYYWSGNEGDGNMKTVFTKTNDSIAQKMLYNGTLSDVFWSFKDTVGGTKVIWKTKGTMTFSQKINAFLEGGTEKNIGNEYEKSLANLDKALDYEINTYTVKINGLVTKLGGFYLEKNITSKISNLSKNLKIMIPNMIWFSKKNNIPMNGKPFVIYNTYDVANGITNFSVCIPIKQEIFILEGSDIACRKLERFLALKTTLTGDYSHNKKAWDKAVDYIAKNNLYKNSNIPLLEVYSIGIEKEKSPSKWVTNIYIAVRSKTVAVPYDRPRVIENTEVVEPSKNDTVTP